MTTVNVVIVGTFLTDVANPTNNVQVFKVDRSEQDAAGVAVRIYAGGRRRIITTPADVRSTSLTLQRVSASDVETLRGWRGRVLLLRDFQGWRRFGTFAEIASQSVFQGLSAPPLYTVTLTWTDVDYNEGV